MITLGEVRNLGKYLLFGLGAWFIYQGAFNVIKEYGLNSLQSILVGMGIMVLLLFLYQFKGVFFK